MVFGLLGSACLVTEECATSATHPAFRPCALPSSRLLTCDEEPSQPAISCPPGTESSSLSHWYAQVLIRHFALNPK